MINKTKKKKASSRFANGPAAETIASSRSELLKFLLSIGTGFAQPIKAKPLANDAIGMIKVPIKSECLNGFRVNLPRFLAVLSPSFEAEYACANSCMVIEIKNIGRKVRNEMSRSLI